MHFFNGKKIKDIFFLYPPEYQGQNIVWKLEKLVFMILQVPLEISA